MENMNYKWLRLGLWVAGCLGVGFASSIFTVEAIPAWYAGLNRPAFAPPNWVFGPVWTLLYGLMGVAAWQVTEVAKGVVKRRAMVWFGLQLFLNFWWSIIFFRWQALGWALGEIIVLWLAIIGTIRTFYGVRPSAGWLLGPYLAWVSFATILATAFFQLNK